jgi:DNA (cytosine-5)-methyltransferase 1
VRILDAFSGIGGITAGSLPGETIGFVEKDLPCQKVLEAAFPGIPIHGDILTFKGDEFGEFDLFAGGFPCQPFSQSGKGWLGDTAGTVRQDDSRASLFLEIVRILTTQKPKAFLLENVEAILRIRNPDGSLFLDTILTALTDIGYSVKYKILCPTQFGVPQQRKRVFFVGIRNDLNKEYEFPKVSLPPACRVLDILDVDVNIKYTLKHIWANKRLKSGGTRIDALIDDLKFGNRELPISGYLNKAYAVSIIYGEIPGYTHKSRRNERLYSVYGWSPTICTFYAPAFYCDDEMRILTQRECLRLQSFPDTHPISSIKSVGYKQVGNSVNVTIVKYLMDSIRELLE